MKPKIWNDITNILAKLASSKDYDPKVKYETALEFYGNQIPVLPKPGAGDNGKSVVAKTDGTYELKKPAVTPADIIAATGEMTSQQAATTLGNIGGEPEKLIVTVTYDALNDEYTADKTFEEIIEAVDSGKSCEVHYGNLIFPMVDYDEDGNSALFCIVRNYNQNAKMYQISTLDDEWYYRERVLEDAPTTVTDLSSTSITLASAADNTIYEYGELTALTVTAITTTGDFIIRFTSGATPTTTSLPVSMKFPEAFVAESNMRYEINCSNGYAVAVGWPTT